MKSKKSNSTTYFEPASGEVKYVDKLNGVEDKLRKHQEASRKTLDKLIMEQNEKLLIVEELYRNEKELRERYEAAYHIMCDSTFELIPDEEKAEIHNKLKRLKL